MDKELKQVTANLEYLKKLFIMPDSPDEFIRLRQDTLSRFAGLRGASLSSAMSC